MNLDCSADVPAYSDTISTGSKCHCYQNVIIAESIKYYLCTFGPAKSVTIQIIAVGMVTMGRNICTTHNHYTCRLRRRQRLP